MLRCEESILGESGWICETHTSPSLVGRISRSRSSSEQGGLPVIAGMKVRWISFSSGNRRSWMSGMVLIR